MKNYIILLGLILTIVSCKNEKSSISDIDLKNEETNLLAKDVQDYPSNLMAIMDVHGGIVQWEKMHNICFSFEGRGGEEVHTTSLKDRMAKIENENWTIGNDGESTWLLESEEGSYKGNAAFYNNLMFYFYAMPFVLADNGIIYTELPQRALAGKMYNALKIGYDNGVGYSPKDEYILFSEPSTNQMAWLGYTVTGTSNKKSDTWSFIKYDQWQEVNGLLLPEKLTWYTVENNEPTEKRNELIFSKVTMTETQLVDSVFAKPDRANAVE
jgi:hypothetical protein